MYDLHLAFFWPVWTASLLLALLAGPLGNLLLWTRTTPLSEAIGHAAICGFVLHLQWPWISNTCGIFLTSWLMAMILFFLHRSKQIASRESWLQQCSHAALALGLSYFYLYPSAWREFSRIFLGELMAIDGQSLIRLGCLTLGFMIWLYFSLSAVITTFTDRELALIEGRWVTFWELTTFLVLASATALLVIHFGLLLTGSILLGPSMISHQWARSPDGAMYLASFLSFLIIFTGFLISTLWLDLPPSSLMTLESFLLVLLASRSR